MRIQLDLYAIEVAAPRNRILISYGIGFDVLECGVFDSRWLFPGGVGLSGEVAGLG